MSARADDRIYRLHPDHQMTVDATKLVHLCAALKSPWGGGVRHRDSLDPCAVNVCRYCREPLPLPREEAGAISEDEA